MDGYMTVWHMGVLWGLSVGAYVRVYSEEDEPLVLGVAESFTSLGW